MRKRLERKAICGANLGDVLRLSDNDTAVCLVAARCHSGCAYQNRVRVNVNSLSGLASMGDNRLFVGRCQPVGFN
ncbi:hypothetical protein COS78_03035 [Candidatus Shapirobacteria bacterium CG06_land_8_20_14_3_00_40_12]|uniref:Uncharacterized protein n=2 Tax=Candidatus Shapironibacteriota TaxID=1752721 RepID=A0A2M7TTI8_9BACT|nr:MAG: hypothetical protein COS78_03035 [Candidatus Shapirobacteria bacterium CG06_land_8_20_14_3_00_40_12]PIZ59675.1 MAG: hypothetical protein COY20_01725 [Candidatus Shapirobacteria bacterium CG_4_10_14_0_2_um_filter_40_12]